MRYTEKIERQIVAQIEETPEKAIILPDWAYWGDEPQPMIYHDHMPITLLRHLFEVIIRPLDDDEGVANAFGVDPRNVNPWLAVVLPSRRARVACKNNHPYTEGDWVEGVGHRCQTCAAEQRKRRIAKLLGTPSPVDLNRQKTHCPQNHEYTPENTVNLKNGKRRCRTCARDQTARWRASKKGTTK